ncbi:MAG TPA: MoxR family ATPase [Armatimonadetes bacterium]|nr:MoxR family ATPase [Armatimonadota bacterium]
METAVVEREVERFRNDFMRIRDEIQKMIVGLTEVVEGVLICLLTDGHALLEGVPGLGKTLLVRTLSQTMNLKFSRIQFTPDLMPADVVGTNIVVDLPDGGRAFQFQAGPIFANVILADEINRATPKTQSALLEAMQERSVTVAGKTYQLEEPFIVLATQNPIEMEGTYPLPEAQVDRFFFKLLVKYPSLSEMMEILNRTTVEKLPDVETIIDGSRILEMRRLVRTVPIAPHVQEYVVRIVLATHPESELSTDMVQRYVRYGASPRGAQALVLGGKVRALLDGRYNVAFEDVEAIAHPALRHRIILNFEGEAEGISTDRIIDEILQRQREAVRESIKRAEVTQTS